MEPDQNVTQEYTDIALYKPNEYERERASNSYLMSVVAIMVGAPLPIVNMLATLFFYIGNRKSTPYVKWHCMQALLSQLTVFIMNAVAFTWTLRIIFGSLTLSDNYIGYIITVVVFNIIEFAITVNAAINVRKGHHVEWPLWGTLTNEILGNQLPVNKK
jgi:uncharacterized Tic20 family protein